MGLDDSVDKGITNLILDDDAVDNGTGDEELVLEVDEVLAESRRGRVVKDRADMSERVRDKKWDKTSTDLSWIALRYAFWIECSTRFAVPMDPVTKNQRPYQSVDRLQRPNQTVFLLTRSA